MPTSELRQSGRVKSKSPVVKENTASDAYFVDDESSGDDFVDENRKGIKVGNRVAKRGSGSNVSHSSDDKEKRAMESNSAAKEKGESSKASTSKPKKEKGKSHLLEFKVDGIPSKLGFYVANSFNADTMEIKLKDMSIVIMQQLIGEMLGIKNEGVDITAEMLYVDGTVCNEFNVGQKRPPTSFWTMELLKEREYEEINARGIGKGELQGPFVDEDDPMPEEEDGFLWKLNTYVDNIRKERDGFERTFVAASNVLRVTDTNTPVLGSSKQLEPINAVPVSMCKTVLKDEDVVHGRGKRKYKKSEAVRSPFMSRVTDINATESKEEKRVKKFLLNKIKIDQSAILFETKTRTKASRKQMESLVNGENIDNAVVDAWSGYLNSLESLRGEIRCQDFSYQRLLCITNYLMDVETVNERAERKNMINLVDLVFIPVSNYGHKFLICINLKFLKVNMIDSKNNLTKEGYHKSIIVTNTNDMVVATVLQKSFCAYLARLNPNKTASVLRVEVTREDFDWKTDKRPNDSGVFWMCHMERIWRYAATLLLLKCNMHSDSVYAQLDGIQVAEVPVKRMKLPTRCK
nr:C2 calcium-dependent membrane targeting [Tanacetum cinerariifolium]